jgi:hypothetical protein
MVYMNVNENKDYEPGLNRDPDPDYPLTPEHKPDPDSNPDPITGEQGARPVGTGVGAASAGVVGTAVGVMVGGPIGGAVGAVVGSVAGGLLGKGVAETLDPTVEDEYWRHNYGTRPYVEPNYTYEDYSPAYRAGYEGHSTYSKQGLSYQEAEPHLKQQYEQQPSSSRLSWDKARHASQDAWHRREQGAFGSDTKLK